MNIRECVYPGESGGFGSGTHVYDKDGFCNICGFKMVEKLEISAESFRAEIHPNGDVWITDRVKQYKPEGGPEVVSVRDGDTIIIPKDKCKELSSLLGHDSLLKVNEQFRKALNLIAFSSGCIWKIESPSQYAKGLADGHRRAAIIAKEALREDD